VRIGETRHVAATLTRVHDDPNLDDHLVSEPDEDEAVLEDENAHTLSIRRASGEEVLTVYSPNEEWSVYLQPGGGLTSAFVGTPSDPIVWVNAADRRVERDEDGTYVIRID
jgi:hypothetical protein